METEQTYRVGEYYLTRNRGGYWCRTWYDEQTRQRRSATLGTKDFQGAKQKLNEWFVENSSPILDDDLELSRCLLEYWKQHAKHLKRSDTERRNAGYWVDFFPGKMVREVRPIEQRKFIEHLRSKGFAKGTIESVFKTGAAAISYAWKNEMLLNPIPLVSVSQHLAKYKMPKKERWRAMGIDEVAAMFDNSTSEKLTRFMILLIGCAGRPEAAIEIQGSRIDLNAGTINLLAEGEAQTNKYRATVRLPSFVRAIYHEGNLVSQSETTPNLNNLRNRHWIPTREAANLDDLVVPYSFRHTMARWFRSQGVEPWHASSQLGHKRKGSEITEIYAPSDPAYLEDALNATVKFFSMVYKKSEGLMRVKGLENYCPRCGVVAKIKKGQQCSLLTP